MKMLLDDAAGLNLVSAYEAGTATIRGQRLRAPLLVLPERVFGDWPVTDLDSLDSKALRQVAAQTPEVFILGTGGQQRFPDLRVFIPLMDAGIGYEIMDNAAACRTFNILLSEGRKAALALLAE